MVKRFARLPLRYKIAAPFLVLVLFVGAVGTAIITAQFTSATAEQFNGNLLRAGMLANDHLALLEAERLSQLRAAANTVGVPEAVSGGDRQTLERLLTPIAGNAQPAVLTLRVLDRLGGPLLSVRSSDAGDDPIPADYRDEAAVLSALVGRTDAWGDKYVFLRPEAGRLMVYWAGPVRAGGQVVGAILLGEPVIAITEGIRASRASELAVYDTAGRVVSSSLSGLPDLGSDVKQRITADRPVRVTQDLSGHPYWLLVSDWTMRGRPAGYLAVGLNAEGLRAELAHIRLLLALLLAAAALLALLLGVALARYVTRPLEQLVVSMHVVSAGDLSHRAPTGQPDEIGYLATTFNQMVGSLQRQRGEREETYFASLEALARAIDARDTYTYEHSARVAAIGLEIAAEMHLPADELTALRRGGLLHDIGKLGVEDHILRKSGPLNDQEWEAIKRHPVIGYDMLKDVPFLAPSLAGIRHHHERWDGDGYPDRLKGEAIPLAVRILSVADAFDAITSDRPYRTSFSLQFALQAIVSGAGTQFDPVVVKAFQSRADRIIALLKGMGKAPAPHAADIHLERSA
jgi:putative nucleotidyltransferase with HDIG domain